MRLFKLNLAQVRNALRSSRVRRMDWVGIVVCGILLLLGDLHSDQTEHYVAYTNPRTENPSGREVLSDGSRGIIEKSLPDEDRDLTLPDSSKVRLAPASTLAYATDFSKKRETYLDGRASFDVKADKNRPFIIHAGHTTLQMLGTRFDVRSYKDGRKSRITVVSGQVRAMNGNGQWKLHPGERAIIEGGKIMIHKIEHPERDLLWRPKGPNLEFDDEELDEVIRELAGAYHVKVFNPDHLEGIPLTGKFLLKEPLNRNLAPIQVIEAWYVRVQRRNDTIFLTKPKP